MHHAAGNEVATPEQGHDFLQLPATQQRADAGAADALAVLEKGLGAIDRETVLLGETLQQQEIAAAMAAELEVIADDESLDRETIDEALPDELVRRARGHVLIEGQHQQLVDAEARQELRLLAQASQARRRGSPGEVLGRLRFEQHHSRLRFAAAGFADECGDDGLVAAVDSVEIADRRHTGLVP